MTFEEAWEEVRSVAPSDYGIMLHEYPRGDVPYNAEPEERWHAHGMPIWSSGNPSGEYVRAASAVDALLALARAIREKDGRS